MAELTLLNPAATSTDLPDTDRTSAAAEVKKKQEKLKDAIEDRNESDVLDLLQSPQWPILLRQSWEKTTPFRELIKKMPKIAERVLDSCAVSNPDESNPKSPDFEVVFDYSFVEDHKDEKEKSERLSQAIVAYSEDREEALKQRFEEVKSQDKKYFTPKYVGPTFKKSNHPLALMVKHKRLELLTHPVISSLLHHKWLHFGLWFYLFNLITYIIFLAFLTSFALTVLNPLSTTCMQVHLNPGIAVCERGTEKTNATGELFAAEYGSGMMANDTNGERNVTCVRCEPSSASSNFVFPGAVITILFALVRLFKEAVQFYYDPKTYLSDLANWIEIALYILSIIFVSVFRTTCMCSQEWQWQLGVVVIFFAWIDLIVICAKSPSIGIYIIMFGKIFLTFLKAIILPVLLVIMFGLTFYMTFSEPEFQRSPFSSTASTMLKIMSMTAGDFSFDTLFRRSPSGESESATEILFPRMSYVLWIIFVILMPVLFTNMLVGLAVGDIQQIEQDAKLRKLALQVNVILTAEDILRIFGKHRRFIRGRKTIKPNTKEEVQEEMEKFEEELKEELNEETKEKEEMNEEMKEETKEGQEEVDAVGKNLDALEKGPDKMEKGQEETKGPEETKPCLLRCIAGLVAYIVRFFVWIFFGFKEFMYQLWEGERYDTLEVLQALNPDLGAEPDTQKDKHTEAITIESVKQIVKEALEECIQEANARSGGKAGSRE